MPDTVEIAEIAAMAHREADSGAPGGMVAVYVELALRHLVSGHEGYWSGCAACHEGLRGPWPLHTEAAVPGARVPQVVPE